MDIQEFHASLTKQEKERLEQSNRLFLSGHVEKVSDDLIDNIIDTIGSTIRSLEDRIDNLQSWQRNFREHKDLAFEPFCDEYNLDIDDVIAVYGNLGTDSLLEDI